MLDIHGELEGDRQDLPMSKATIDSGFLRAIWILLHVRGSSGGEGDGDEEASEGTMPVRAQHGCSS